MESSKKLNVILVSSRKGELLEETLERMSFFLLGTHTEANPVVIETIQDFENHMKTPLNHNVFLDRLIPRNETDPQDASKKIPIPETRPKVKKLPDGIITDLFLRRDEFAKELDIHGIGVIAWAVRYGIPVGLIARDYDTNPQFAWKGTNPYYYEQSDKFFWIDSVLDTLRTDARYSYNKIPVGDANKVCRSLRDIILKKK
ncbi:MAG: hypothetical protein KBC42_00620 [Candidatus Pacebacteria bacterium]|nr:hypothetical protein [Candidatus Paceibacterota bacterium]MBP9780411.1 hypothetical protein [Candidatus Paceibacterota bacterium]